MFRYVLLSISCLLLLTACGDGLTGQGGGEKPAVDGNPQDVGKDVPRFLNQPNPQSCSDCLLTRRDLTGADLSHAILYKVDLTGAILTEANLTGANLTGADMRGAIRHRADAPKANLTGASLNWSDWTGADLHEADLSGANLDGVIGADFTGALYVPPEYR